MNAISLYVTASRLLFQSEAGDQNNTDLYRLVPYLRQSLSCTVCANLLIEPYSPQDVCQHHVCRACLGGRKNLKPTCLLCRNYQSYQANAQLRILLQCYKSLCKYILSTPPIYSSMHKHRQTGNIINGSHEAQSLADLIDEGASFHDEYKSNPGLSKSSFSILPCIFQPQPSQQTYTKPVANNININQTRASSAPSAADEKNSHSMVAVTTINTVLPNPPIKTVSNGSTLYSVMYAGSGNKITIKRKTDSNNMFNKKTESPNTLSAKEMLNMLTGQSSSSEMQQSGQAAQTQAFKKPATSKTKAMQKRKGCRCGNATPTPGKLTCCGQRCPCYVDSKSCVDCKCRGCRNPHRIDGFKVRPQIPELNCFVQMNNDSLSNNYIDLPMPMDTFNSHNTTKQDSSNHHNNHFIDVQSEHLDLDNDSIEYLPNDLDDTNIQVVNVYTTHLPDVSTTLPTIIMQEGPSINTTSSNNSSTSATAKLSMPSPEPTSYTLFGDDMMTHSFSDEGCSSDDRSDVEIDI